jgi:hypothetical protein
MSFLVGCGLLRTVTQLYEFNNTLEKMFTAFRRCVEVNYLSKINPGSDVYEDNDLKPMSGMLNGDVPEPRMLKKGKFQCPVCHETFSSKEHYIHHAMIHHQSPPKLKNPLLLNSVEYEKGFHFFIEPGKYTGITATSLNEYAKELNTVPVESVKFHFQRQDYQKWLRDTIGDEELAKRIDNIEGTKMSSDEDLRMELSKTVQNRIAELREA